MDTKAWSNSDCGVKCQSPNYNSHSTSFHDTKVENTNRNHSETPKRSRCQLTNTGINVNNVLGIGTRVYNCHLQDMLDGVNSENKRCSKFESGKHPREFNDAMALNAIVMSGGGGGRGITKRSTQKTSMEIDGDPSAARSVWRNFDQTELASDKNFTSKCMCDKTGKFEETVRINVGGQVFETYFSTLKRIKSCKLSCEREMMKYYRPDKGDFFFDRDPYAFNIILNYLRYGDLHLPTNLCGPALMREFQFWDVNETDIERCCFQPYNTWKAQTKSLEKLEYDRKQSTTQTDLAHDRKSNNIWRRIRSIVWPFLQDPSSSKTAKIYAWVSIVFVFMSIFSFCAETHPFFKISPADVHNLRILYKFFALEDSKTIIEDSNFKKESSTHQEAMTNFENSSSLNMHNSSSDITMAVTNVNKGLTIQHPALLVIDLTCVLFFSLEFLIRLVFCPKKLRFCTSLQNIIDFIAIVPDYVEFIILITDPKHGSELGFVDFIFILRMLRLCRIFRLIRHVPGLWILLYTLKASFNELLLMFVFLLIGMVMFASLLHFIEGGEKFSNIPVGFWWAVVTMTTVGYGDMVPVTGLGYVIGSVCAISGLLMIAFTVPIIVSNFVLYYTHVQYGISDKDELQGTDIEEIYNVNNDIGACSMPINSTASVVENKKHSPNIENSVQEELPNNSLDIRETNI